MNWLFLFLAGSGWLFAIWGFCVFFGVRQRGLSSWPEYWLAALAIAVLAPLAAVVLLRAGVVAPSNIITTAFNASLGRDMFAMDGTVQSGFSVFVVLAGLVYGLGTGILFLRLIRQFKFLYRVKNTGVQRLDVGYDIVETQETCPPCSVGIFRPAIIIPSTLRGHLSKNHRSMIYAHEAAHIRYHDPAVMLGLYMLKALLWPYPPVHDLTRRWLAAAEQRADNAALLGANKNLRETYGRLLLEVLRKYSGKALPCPSASLNLEHLRSAKMRVKNIMNENTETIKTRQRKIQLGMLTVAVGLLGTTGLIASAGENIFPDRDAQPSVRFPPMFPAKCTANPGKYAASVIVKFDVGKGGVVENVRVAKSDNPCFNEASTNSVAKWQYEPYPRKRKGVQAMIKFMLSENAEGKEIGYLMPNKNKDRK
jgi:TonB family protein